MRSPDAFRRGASVPTRTWRALRFISPRVQATTSLATRSRSMVAWCSPVRGSRLRDNVRRDVPLPAKRPVSSTLGNLLERTSQAAAGNGIFIVGDRRPKTCLRGETYAQRRKSRPHDRENPAENRPFRRKVFHGEFRRTGWWANQGSNLGPTDQGSLYPGAALAHMTFVKIGPRAHLSTEWAAQAGGR